MSAHNISQGRSKVLVTAALSIVALQAHHLQEAAQGTPSLSKVETTAATHKYYGPLSTTAALGYKDTAGWATLHSPSFTVDLSRV